MPREQTKVTIQGAYTTREVVYEKQDDGSWHQVSETVTDHTQHNLPPPPSGAGEPIIDPPFWDKFAAWQQQLAAADRARKDANKP